MRNLWMGVIPGPTATRVLVLDGPDKTLLKARLPGSPRHPRAITTLGEALAMWCCRTVRAALVADGPAASSVMSPWLSTYEAHVSSPLVQVDLVSHVRPPRERDGLDGLGDFRDLRQLLVREVAR